MFVYIPGKKRTSSNHTLSVFPSKAAVFWVERPFLQRAFTVDLPGTIRIKTICLLRAKEMETREVNIIFKVIFNKTESKKGLCFP